MLLTSEDISSDTGENLCVELRPVGYQFRAPLGDPYDDNWLVIAGRVVAPQGRWRFEEPVLLTDEARKLARWLRYAAGGRIAVSPGGPDLSFLEGNLAFSLAAESGDRVVLRVHLSLESAPARLGDQVAVEVPLAKAGLLAAAETWEQELVPFPAR
ncbi:WapI family immunity protein [Kitasatospora viridis]|uniref:Uncharacterized protein n=1 Tax=Kitasatospora viridis TaxID=281105 RepID=A0A561SDN0_9ACTN|nr:hypothetical protein [Kitasatospora viridis]TWF72967.1 hypothetical protein FHX73_16118 [Kitasatospora viridis]